MCIMLKRAYVYAKRVLRIRQKRPTYLRAWGVRVYIMLKRASRWHEACFLLCIWQKKPMHVAKEAYSCGKKRPIHTGIPEKGEC